MMAHLVPVRFSNGWRELKPQLDRLQLLHRLSTTLTVCMQTDIDLQLVHLLLHSSQFQSCNRLAKVLRLQYSYCLNYEFKSGTDEDSTAGPDRTRGLTNVLVSGVWLAVSSVPSRFCSPLHCRRRLVVQFTCKCPVLCKNTVCTVSFEYGCLHYNFRSLARQMPGCLPCHVAPGIPKVQSARPVERGCVGF